MFEPNNIIFSLNQDIQLNLAKIAGKKLSSSTICSWMDSKFIKFTKT